MCVAHTRTHPCKSTRLIPTQAHRLFSVLSPVVYMRVCTHPWRYMVVHSVTYPGYRAHTPRHMHVHLSVELHIIIHFSEVVYRFLPVGFSPHTLNTPWSCPGFLRAHSSGPEPRWWVSVVLWSISLGRSGEQPATHWNVFSDAGTYSIITYILQAWTVKTGRIKDWRACGLDPQNHTWAYLLNAQHHCQASPLLSSKSQCFCHSCLVSCVTEARLFFSFLPKMIFFLSLSRLNLFHWRVVATPVCVYMLLERWGGGREEKVNTE